MTGTLTVRRFTMRVLFFTVLMLCLVNLCRADNTEFFLQEEFRDLEEWRELTFPEIKEHSRYTTERETDTSFLKAESTASASGIVFKKEFNVYDFPKARWRWKISNVYKEGNAKEKSGDDYPIRVYIVFKYDPDTASFGRKIKYGIVKKLYGEYPPHSSLNYIWANKRHEERFLTNTYADQAKMVILQTGADNAGIWKDEEVNILDDYREAFGGDPPPVAGIAIMNDSDNTGESSVSYIDYIEVFR
jgi:hypothetical protein